MNEEDARALAEVVAAYRATLVACAWPGDLTDQLTAEFQTALLAHVFAAARGPRQIETQPGIGGRLK